MSVFCLSHHARYQCRHAGACCRAGWNIPVEDHLRPRLGTALLAPDAAGACPRYDPEAHRCSVHRDFGEDVLPLSCNQFPRVSLLDDRGVFVTLSHFCPTAAALLFEPGRLSVVCDPAAFPASRRYDGLDARGAWAPLVRERLLFGLDDYTRWEHWMVGVLATAVTPWRAICRIAHAAETLRAWTANQGPFSDWLGAACEAASETEPLPRDVYSALTGTTALAGMPWRDSPPPPMPGSALATGPAQHNGTALLQHGMVNSSAGLLDHFAAPVNRYLAAKAFATWNAYQGGGVRTLVAELIVTLTVLRGEVERQAALGGRPLDEALLFQSFRSSDWQLVHCLDREGFTRWLATVEAR